MQLWCEALSLLLCCYQWAAQPRNTRKPTGFRYLVVSEHVMYRELLPISEHINCARGVPYPPSISWGNCIRWAERRSLRIKIELTIIQFFIHIPQFQTVRSSSSYEPNMFNPVLASMAIASTPLPPFVNRLRKMTNPRNSTDPKAGAMAPGLHD